MSGTNRYAWSQRALHWLIAVMIIGSFIAGSVMSDIGFSDVTKEQAAFRDQLYAMHKTFGVALLALVALRIVLRLIFGAPPPADLPRLQAIAASAAHIALYGLMVAVPLLGWLMISAGGFLSLSPLIDGSLPPLTGRDTALAASLKEAHDIAATALVAIAGIHAAGGLYHLFKGDGVFQRIWFGGRAA